MAARLLSRMSPPRWSVRSRILASILVVTAFGMAVAGGAAYLVQRERTLSEIDDRLLSRVESARFVVTGESRAGDSAAGEGTSAEIGDSDRGTAAAPERVQYASTTEALEGVLARVTPRRNESSLGVIDGEASWVPGFAIDFHLEDDPELIDRIVSEVGADSVRIGSADSSLGRLRYVAVPVTVAGSPERGLYITAIGVDRELAPLNATFGTFTLVALGSLIAVGAVGWFVAGRLLRPIRQLRMAASRITASELHERIPVVGSDDVSELTTTVNGMLDRLDRAMTGQRQLLDDVRHELKTPITIVRGHLELLDPADVAEVSSTRDLAIEELDRMSGLVDGIEFLAESERDQQVWTPTDVADLTATVYAKVRAIAGHDWVLADSAEVSMMLDPARITQGWLQLADNAAKYSPAGTAIELGSREVVSGTERTVELWVADNGPGVPPGAEERIFERFGRADTGRGIRGSGLGLPIVMAIASSHGGTVDLVSSPSGSRFAIVLPVFPIATVESAEPAEPIEPAETAKQGDDTQLVSSRKNPRPTDAREKERQ